MTLEELKKIRTILSAATGLEDEDQEIIGAALKAIDALIKPRTTKPAAQPAPVQGWRADVQKVRDSLEPEDWCGDEKMIDVLDRVLAQKPCCSNMAAGTSCLSDPNANCPLLATPRAAPVPLTDEQINAIWNARDLPEHQSKLSAFGMDRIRAIIKAALNTPPAQPAPVQPVAWADAYAISNLPAVDEAIRALLDDKTADNATAVVQAILGAVPPKQPAPVQELQRYSPNGEGGMEVDSLGAYVKHQDVSNPPAAPVQELELAGFAMKDGIPVSAVFSDGSHAVSVDGFTWTAQPPAAPVQKQPQNCGTGYCSCIECVMEPAPVQVDAWPCVIAEADFEQNTITLKMQCSDYKVGAGKHWLHTTKPAAQPAQPAVPEGWKLVPAVPTNEWVNNLAKMQTGNLEEVPFVEIHQCIAELLAAAPKKGQL